jgi:hypothetical protein
VPLVSDKADPVLAHWQYGLGRAVAFTSDAKAKWGADWLAWGKYRQFWSQVAQWSLRRLDMADFSAEVSVEQGEGLLGVESLDAEGNYRNFLNLQALVISPKGDRATVRLEQTGPGRYEARFPTKEVGAYVINLLELKDGKIAAGQTIGASVNYSPEFSTTEPNLNLLHRVAEAGGGKVFPADLLPDRNNNPFLHDRQKTYQPRDLWEWLLKAAVLLFVIDVGVRRIYLDRAEWLKATENLRRWFFFWRGAPRPVEADESLAALLARRQQVRAERMPAMVEARTDLAESPRLGAPLPGGALGRGASRPEPAAVAEPPAAAPEGGRPSTTGRLLEAKRRAARRLDQR